METLQLVSQVILLYLPAMAANMAPVFANRYNMIPWLNRPIDFGIKQGGVRLLGDNKTMRGLVFGALVGACVGAIESWIISSGPLASMSFAIAYGFTTGFGALVGDSVKSFFKRRKNIPSGTSWIPFDQIDFVLGATVFALFFIRIPVLVAMIAIIFIGIASYVVSKIGFALHIKKNL